MNFKINYSAFWDNCNYHSLILTEYFKNTFDTSLPELIRLINILYIKSFEDILIAVSESPTFVMNDKLYIFNGHDCVTLEICHIRLITGIIDGWIATTATAEQYEIKRTDNGYNVTNITNQKYEIINNQIFKSKYGINGFIKNSYCSYNKVNNYEFKMLNDYIIINGEDVCMTWYYNTISNYSDIILNDIIKMKCNYDHTFFLTTDSLYGLGSNEYGKLGLNQLPRVTIPQRINGILDFDGGYNHTLVNTTDGLYVTGSNDYGQLAN